MVFFILIFYVIIIWLKIAQVLEHFIIDDEISRIYFLLMF
jgi:hypothetical protein